MSSFHYYLWRMYFVSLSCVSKRMAAEKLNWQWERKLFLKCRRFIITFGGCTLCPSPVSRRGWRPRGWTGRVCRRWWRGPSAYRAHFLSAPHPKEFSTSTFHNDRSEKCIKQLLNESMDIRARISFSAGIGICFTHHLPDTEYRHSLYLPLRETKD